jgi:hypothetical protein
MLQLTEIKRLGLYTVIIGSTSAKNSDAQMDPMILHLEDPHF